MQQVRVKIDGNMIPNVLSVETGLDVASGPDGHPQDARPRLTGIRIVRESDKDTTQWDWAIEPWAEAFKDGEIEFLDPVKEDTVIRTIRWEQGFLSAYREDVPHIQYAREAPMTETIEISARVFDLDGAKFEAYKS